MEDHQVKVLWYRGRCDVLLAKLQAWLKVYERGVVSHTRPWLRPDGKILDIPTQYAHKLIWNEWELAYLVSAMTQTSVKKTLIEDVIRVRDNMKKRAKLVNGKEYIVTMNYAKADIQVMIDSLSQIKTGITPPDPDAARKEVAEKKKAGVGLWETK